MNEIKQEIRIIRESQIRMEDDLRYHIKRTDALEQKVTPIHKIYIFFNYFIISITIIAAGLAVFKGVN